uniref:Protease, putative n=1 Tax=Chlorobium chlorochromatii (strain CaD3) TaxID=340177 RepID=Q3AP41_CHLCH
MSLLAIECTHEALSVALEHHGTIREVQSSEWKKAAESIVPLVQQVVAESDATFQALSAIVISAGPGSFTALRIGMAAAKGMAYALDIPLLPVPTLPAMAASLQASEDAVVAVIQARRGEYYYALYHATDVAANRWHNDVQRGSADVVVDAALMAARVGSVVVVGRKLLDLQQPLAEANIALLEADCFSARSLLAAAERQRTAKQMVPLEQIVPDYQQAFVPTMGKMG